ncbi:osmotically inducible periplasmic protein OsmY [Amycolatopsis mediterranei S699]|uniref:Osmotically inducible periplasmic protein OsmY n=2 Tax=Amycolatopsis mediterranei TaxID=33910 RepID=A0A0H3D8M2_AMYMU|nr:BON domain-containing protein [Amycolatopsis mediterranei]ADJ47330.1 osmotically inducible periplasmic protein OsmY [Amycolatopsis mediterranei U32]AEK44162.1 osmotically inducible periplasmic protein OsmY [Amycolatopsis mediterranei S699]AFO79041.1 osmotically inducible periplasmic protein OsmY [Amycolatopsis mediterranei S699]AGT86169.1 osmotically inducible periplasmic protein OsmY [Amycolatopsis mediterranei RB]KDO12483.1 ornithine cyclodeaminase [Amycolatopsis mediterranei]
MTELQHRPDHHLKTAVTDELAWTPSVNAEGIGVTVSGGVATLSGHVGTYPEKEEALRAATRVQGVTTTVDKIIVRHGHDVPADADLARDAMTVFDRHTVLVPKDSVQVDVRDRVITLRGSVDWHHQREAARRAVAVLPGINGVRNLITLRPSPGVTPAETKARIIAALARHAPGFAQHVEVGIDDGQVTLTGQVLTPAERRSAEQTAWFAPDVTAVDNQVKLSG